MDWITLKKLNLKILRFTNQLTIAIKIISWIQYNQTDNINKYIIKIKIPYKNKAMIILKITNRMYMNNYKKPKNINKHKY
jgi:hypothetical protein